MTETPQPPAIPDHHSLLDGISIEIELYAENLARAGRGDHALEDWFWSITVENKTNPFCTVKGFWGLCVVRSRHPIDLTFNTNDNTSVIQLWPDDDPLKFVVKEDSDGLNIGICLIAYFNRPGHGTVRLSRGLYMYSSA